MISATRLKTAVRELMRTCGPIAQLPQRVCPFLHWHGVRPLLPRIEALAIKLMALANLNRTIHLPTYNRLIGEAALAMRAASA